MKKLLFSLSLLASLATFAGESSVAVTAQVYGLLPVYSAASNVIVSVPWRAAANTDQAISVADIIRTAELTVGDWIRLWDNANNKYLVWELQNVSGVKTWVASKTISKDGTTEGGAPDETTLKRGDALILHRQNPATFYVQGQYLALSSSDKTTVNAGTSETPAYTLIAPPMTTSVDLNTNMTWSSDIEAKDRLVYGQSASMGTEYRYKNKKWGYYTQDAKGKTVFTNAPAIPAGVGFWYVSKGGNPTVTWVAPAE